MKTRVGKVFLNMLVLGKYELGVLCTNIEHYEKSATIGVKFHRKRMSCRRVQAQTEIPPPPRSPLPPRNKLGDAY